MKVLAAVFANLLLLSSAFGLGGLIRPLLPRKLLAIDRLAVIPLTGLGLLGLLFFLLGLVRFTRLTLLTVLIPCALLGIRCFLQEMRKTSPGVAFRRISMVPMLVVALVLMVTILGGLAEPVGDIRMDTIAYHYLGPKVWLREGVVRPILDESLTAFPATVEIQYAPLMLLGGQRGPELFSTAAFVLMLLTAAGLALRCGLDPIQAWWVAAVISTMPAVYRGLFGGLIDVIYAGFVLAAARISFDAERPNQFAAAGLFCGFAMGTKYTGVITTLLLLACIFLIPSNSTERFSKVAIKRLSLIGLVSSLIAAPWYIRNWVVLGCPIYPPPPLLSKIFHVRYLSEGAIQRFHDLMFLVGRGMGQSLLDLLALPLNLTFHPANFESGAGGIGLVPLAFLPLSLLVRGWDSFSKAFALYGFLSTIAWFYTMQESRYLIHVYIIAAIFGVAGWSHVVRTGPRFVRVLSASTVAVSLLYGFFMIVSMRANDMTAAVSASFAETRKQMEIPFLESFRYLNRDPSVGKVLILDPFVPPYFLDKEYVKIIGRRGEQPLPGVDTPMEALSRLPQWGITHVLDVKEEEGEFQVLDRPKNLVLIFESKNQRIYRVQSTTTSPQTQP